MTKNLIDEMLIEGRLERVPKDDALAVRMLRTATRNLDAIDSIARSATELAYTGAYDAARLAVTAHMAVNGLRATNRLGAHVTVMKYAESELSNIVDSEVLDSLDSMRRIRNDTEYGARSVSVLEVDDAKSMALAVVAGVTQIVLRNQP